MWFRKNRSKCDHCWHLANEARTKPGACQEKYSVNVYRCCNCLKTKPVTFDW